MGEKILVVEDDLRIQELIVEFLSSQDYLVEAASDGIEGYEKYRESNYDLIILDVMMPKLDGYGLAKMIRKKDKETPIIFLTALGQEDDEVKGFEVEADDYITKPFSFKILIKRVEVALKRSSLLNNSNVEITYKDLVLNTKTYKAYSSGEEAELTLKEFNILKLFITSYPTVVKREDIIEKIWKYDYIGDTRVIDAHVKNIRKKVKNNYIKTVKGIGYVLD